MSTNDSNDTINEYIDIIKEAEQKATESEFNNKSEKSDSDFLKLEDAYKESIKEAEHLKDQLVRNLAETDNLRKRTAKQIEDSSKYAVSNFAKDLIEVLENLYLASSNIPKEKLADDPLLNSIYKGVEITQTTLMNVFEKFGIKRINPEIGELFDHNLHEAVSQVPDQNVKPNTIINVMRAGYILHDRLLKPAMVIVAKSN